MDRVSSEMPNLFDLVEEAHTTGLAVAAFSVAADEGARIGLCNDDVRQFGLCSDDVLQFGLCSDDVTGQNTELSVLSDEGNDG
jgi:hypothetical protein